jgi:hypothetical protein
LAELIEDRSTGFDMEPTGFFLMKLMKLNLAVDCCAVILRDKKFDGAWNLDVNGQK